MRRGAPSRRRSGHHRDTYLWVWAVRVIVRELLFYFTNVGSEVVGSEVGGKVGNGEVTVVGGKVVVCFGYYQIDSDVADFIVLFLLRRQPGLLPSLG